LASTREQHHDLDDALDIRHRRVPLAPAPTSIGEFDVSAFCTDVGVPLRDAAESAVAFKRLQQDHPDVTANSSYVKFPDSLGRIPLAPDNFGPTYQTATI
jgi:hypothetical protein